MLCHSIVYPLFWHAGVLASWQTLPRKPSRAPYRAVVSGYRHTCPDYTAVHWQALVVLLLKPPVDGQLCKWQGQRSCLLCRGQHLLMGMSHPAIRGSPSQIRSHLRLEVHSCTVHVCVPPAGKLSIQHAALGLHISCNTCDTSQPSSRPQGSRTLLYNAGENEFKCINQGSWF